MPVNTENDTALKENDTPEEKALPAVKKPKKSKKRTVLTVCAVLAAAAVVTALLWPKGQGALTVSYGDTTVLAKGDFSNSISATGTVESSDSHNIYSTQNYVVDEIYVEVGDKVDADTLLCQLDTRTLEDQIEAKELATGLSAKAAAQTVKTARDSYNAAKSAVDGGKNSSLISAESGVVTAYENWQRAQKTYDDYADLLDDGLNSALIAQDSAVENAKKSLTAARDAYSDAKSAADAAKAALNAYTPDTSGNDAAVSAAQTAYDGAVLDLQLKQSACDSAVTAYKAAQDAYSADPSDANASAMASAKSAYEAAQTALDAAKSSVTSAKTALDSAKSLQSQQTDSSYLALKSACDAKADALASAKDALDYAQGAYAWAVASRESACRSVDNTLADYAVAVDNAYTSYQTALASYGGTEASVEASLQSSYNSLQSAEIGADNSSAVLELAQLQEDLDDTSIHAGVEGTVTAVFAKVGSSGSGLLFVIENTEDLIVETSVKEYDVGSVKTGMPVTIESEATGDDVYDGEIISIAPTTNKNAQGETDTTGDAEFAVKVRVSSEKTGLRIGMSVRLNYIIEQQQDVYSVPYDAVYTNDAGDTCVMTVAETSSKYRLKEVKVERGAENDLYIVVSGDGITDGVRVLSEPDDYKNFSGSEITLADAAPMPAMMFQMA